MVLLGRSVCLVQLVQLESMGLWDRLDSRAFQGSQVTLEVPERPVPLETSVQLVLPEKQEHLVRRDCLDHKVELDRLDSPDPLALKVVLANLDFRDQLDNQDSLDHKVDIAFFVLNV